MMEIDGHGLTVHDVWRVAVEKESCKIADRARPLIRKSRALVEKLASTPRAIYGINTGLGPLSHTRVSDQDFGKHQENILHHLSVGQGELYGPRETRAIMVARANALARGYSGIREEILDLLLEALAHDLLPEIPVEGSVGASGDLVPLAHMARMLVGWGHVRVGDRRLPAAAALKERGLSPATLQCKEGLALVNGTSVMTGVAAISVQEAHAVLGWMEFLSACMIQTLFGEPEILCDQIHRARGHRGQFVVAQRIARHLETQPDYASKIRDHVWGAKPKPIEPGVEIQDPYSLRCAPQILGAFQDALWHVDQVVTRELNASTDNPLIFPDTESVIHGGNFYGQHVSMVSDYLRMGLIKLALLSERQTERLLNWRYSLGLPPLLTGGEPGLNSGFGGCQLLATSLAAEARLLGSPASIQTIPTNANNQDVVSMGAIAARMTQKTLPLVWKLLAIEALALTQAADQREKEGRPVMGGDFAKLHARIRSVSAELVADRPLFEDIDSVRSLLQSSEVQAECLSPRPTNPIAVDLKESGN